MVQAVLWVWVKPADQTFSGGILDESGEGVAGLHGGVLVELRRGVALGN
jgi:hypothetical protein